MLDPDIEAKIHNSFARQSLMATFQAKIAQLDSGVVFLEAPIAANALQQHGFAHAGLTFALADSAAGYAALTTMAPDAEVVTAQFNIHLLAPAKGDRLVAEGRVTKPGRRIVVVTADVFAITETGRVHVASGTGTMVPTTMPT